jgi:UDP-glucuronate 4-epimerase
MRILVTGAAGFIGFHVATRLLAERGHVVGLDNLNSYYDPVLKQARLAHLEEHPRFEFLLADITDRAAMESLFAREDFDLVIHLAAQAGVRYSVENPHAYTSNNVTGFLHVLEGCRRGRVGHLIYASSSSVYGGNTKIPFAVGDFVDHPVSLYAATKKANELMAHSYMHLFGIPATGLRFFTVYGPWGRPDMAPVRFAQAILAGESIDLYNYGCMKRDFTYVGDIAEALIRIARLPASGYRLFNVGSSEPVPLLEFVGELERALGKRAKKRFLPMQPGDIVSTHADVEELRRVTGYCPSTSLRDGVQKFANWFLTYNRELKPRAIPELVSSKGLV